MTAIGFEAQDRGTVFVLRSMAPQSKGSHEFHFPAVDTATETFLWRRRADLEAAIDALTGQAAEDGRHRGSHSHVGRPQEDARDATTLAGLRAEMRRRSSQRAQSTSPKRQPRSRTRVRGPNQTARSLSRARTRDSGGSRSHSERLQLTLIRQAFDRLDVENEGRITAKTLTHAFQLMGRDASQRAVSAWIKERDIDGDGAVNFQEFAASLHALVPDGATDSMGQRAKQADWQTCLNSAFGTMRLHCTVEQCRAAAAFMADRIDAISQSPTDTSLWRIPVASAGFQRRVGCLRGGIAFCEALGFRIEENGTVLALCVGDRPRDKVPIEVLEQLKQRHWKLTSHMRGLDHPEVSDLAAVGEAVALLGRSGDAAAHASCVKTVITYADNILMNPSQSRYRHISTANSGFTRRIAAVPGGVDLLVAMGFREDAEGSLIFPRTGDLSVLAARKAELEAGLPDLLKLVENSDEGNCDEAKPSKSRSLRKDLPESGAAKKSTMRSNPRSALSSSATEQRKLSVTGEKLKKEVQSRMRAEADAEKARRESQQLRTDVKVLSETLQSHIAQTMPARDAVTLLRMAPPARSRTAEVASNMGMQIRIGDDVRQTVRPSTDSAAKAATDLICDALGGETRVSVRRPGIFKPGVVASIGAGSTRDDQFVLAVSGSELILEVPLSHHHPSGERVVMLRPGRKDISAFHHRRVRAMIRDDIIMDVISSAVAKGESVAATKRSHARFQMRPVEKFVFAAVNVFEHLSDGTDATDLLSIPGTGELLSAPASGHRGVRIWEEILTIGDLRRYFIRLDEYGEGCLRIEKLEAIPAQDPLVLAHIFSGRTETVTGLVESIKAELASAGTQTVSWRIFAKYFGPDFAARAVDLACVLKQGWQDTAWGKLTKEGDVEELKLEFDMFDVCGDGCLTLQVKKFECYCHITTFSYLLFFSRKCSNCYAVWMAIPYQRVKFKTLPGLLDFLLDAPSHFLPLQSFALLIFPVHLVLRP
jgi:hypothetical protein